MLVNTELFREPANHFKKYGYYNNAIEGTKEWEEYWDTQRRRCLNGYTVGGMEITGFHYYYLNFFPILRISDESLLQTDSKSVDKIKDFPAFWDGDYTYFWTLEIARNGITKSKYEDLNLLAEIDEDSLSGGRHVAVLKARGKGYSYKNASMLSRNFHLGTESKNFAIANETEFLTKDGLLTKVWGHLDFMVQHTAFGQPKLIDRELHKTAGYSVKTGQGYQERGKLNQVIGVTCHNDPEKARGKRGDLIFFEEGGKFPHLKKAWEVCRPSVEQGAFTSGLMVVFGTGGEEGSDFEGLEELFYSPDAYNIIALDNQWDDGAEGTTCSFFHPASWNTEGFMDEDGNSNEEEAIEYYKKEREKKKKAPDPKAITQYVCEHPLTPQEATTQADVNCLPTNELQAQLNSVRANERWRFGTPGKLYRAEEGVKFKPSTDVKPIMKYPHGPKDDITGGVVMYQSPKRINGKVPKNMYVVCHDPYDHDSSTDGTSLGAAYVLKRTNRFDKTLNECIVASYVGRPNTQDEYNKNLFLLAEYFNAKIGYENDRGNVKEYAQRMHKLHMLEEQFEILDKKELQSKNVNRPYGMHMTTPRKDQGELYLRDWLMTPVTTRDGGEDKLVVHTIFEPALLQELIKYHKKGNFDRVLALMIGQYYIKELVHKQVTETEATPHEDFFLKKSHFH